MFGHILIPIDGSSLSMAAMRKAIALAHDAKARVTVLTVIEPFRIFSVSPEQLESTQEQYSEEARRQADLALEEAAADAKTHDVPVEIAAIESDDPYRVIIETAQKRGCDLVAMASHGRRGFAALLLGSVTVKVLTHSKVPVLVYR